MLTATFIGDIAIAAGAYVVAIFTWPWLRTKLLGAQAEADRLRARANAVLDAVKKA